MPKTQISKSQVRILICPEKVWACILKTLKARSHNLKLERVLDLHKKMMVLLSRNYHLPPLQATVCKVAVIFA